MKFVVIFSLSLLLNGYVEAQTAAPPVVKEGKTVKISEHVFVIPDELRPMVPNVGIVVGKRATLIVDPGLGARSGEAVMRETARVSGNRELYLVTTHFHPEHTTGEAGLPPTAKLVRARAQQQDVDEMGLEWVKIFAGRSPIVGDVLKGFTSFRKPDELFEAEETLGLGGVKVRCVRLGPGHTRGDTVFYVDEDRVLFSGDLAMSGAFPAFATPQSRSDTWLKSLDALDALHAQRLVPSHGPLADASIIGQYRAYIKSLQERVAELKRSGKSAKDAADVLAVEFRAKHPDWAQPARIAPAVNSIYAQTP
ncbi:MAG TPA: MBL fold metallo-hydrolase [Burkholderiales bacterium]|jgi:glyoxylase-like metal-dependent hydrolase (beta-lactamase superfamily II)